jgi:subtilisin-like proprotein convertase family protein
LFFGALVTIITAMLAAPVLRTTHGAGNLKQSGKGGRPVAVSKPGDPDTGGQGAPPTSRGPSGKEGRFANIDVRVNEKGAIAQLVAANASTIAKQARTQGLTIQKGISSLKARNPGVEAKGSPLTGAVEVLRSRTGALTDASPGNTGDAIVRSFIQDNSSVYGLSRNDISNLNFIGESVSQASGLRMVRVEQIVNGLPVFQSETRFILDADGRLFRSTGTMIPNASATARTPPVVSELISPQQALVHAMASVGIPMDASQASLADANAEGTKAEIVAANARISGNVTSKLVYFPLAPGMLLPAWSQVTFTDGTGDYYTIVDASSGKLLWRKNIRDNASAHDARFRVYVQPDGTTPADSPAPLSPTTATPGSGTQPPGIAPTIVSMHTAMSATASPNGWIDDCPGGVCTAGQTQTIGNNVHAYMDAQGGANNNQPDTNAAFVLDGAGKPTGNPDANARNRDFLGTTPRDFQTGYLPPPQGGNPEAGQTATGNGNNGTLAIDQFRRGMVTHLFYVTNWYHDKLFALGFDEAAGNFQLVNFSGQGLGNDRVLAEGQDNASVNNANFSTPPDGQSGRAQMFRFTGPTIDRDGDLDAEILMHELTHGTSNRLIGNGAGLNWDVGGGMGEGWSDFYALSLLNNTNADDPNGQYASGAYATYKLLGLLDNYVYGIRRFPYSTVNTINPLTWADVDQVTFNSSGGIATSPLSPNFDGGGALEVHNVGEVWCMTLWEVRSRIIAANAGDVPTGNQKMLQIVTDGMKMTPISPSFVDARDALIDADCAANACANEQSIWDGFADRGLGYNAVAPLGISLSMNASSHMGIGESFSAPFLDVAGFSVDDSSGNNNGAVDPGETVNLTVFLQNPWRNLSKSVASATATLATTTPGITITDGNSTYPGILPQGIAGGDTFQFKVPLSGVACGQSLKFTITSNSSLGTKAVDFVIRLGAPNGNGAPITYTRTPASPITIAPPGNTSPANFPGIKDAQTITDDFEIADLNFRIDNIQHTFNGDLTAMLRGPNGYGNDFISFIDGTTDGGPGDNLINMVIDDEAAPPNDLLLATAAQAPYTDDWLPIFNSPTFALTVLGPADPVPQLSRYDGLSTQGVWNINVSDQFNGDGGTLNAWSIIVTPKAFTCQAFASVPLLIISEFRVRGPGGANDEFIELYNNSGADLTVAGAGTGYAVAASDGVTRCVVPNGTVIPNRGHYLCVNSVAYSQANYPAGGVASTATGNATYTTDIPDNAGIAVFNTSVAANFTLANRFDAVGSTSEANTLYKEGTGYPALTPFSIDYAFVRDNCGKSGSIPTFGPCPTGGLPVDTDNNAADFYFVDTNGTSAGAGQRLGAPGPENLSSPIQRNANFGGPNLDQTVATSNPPNRVRDFTSVPAQNSTFGTLSIRKRIINSTGAPVTRLRFRVIDITTFPAPSGIADLRVRSSTAVVVSGINDAGTCLASNGVATTPCTVTVQGTTLEQADPPPGSVSQPNGGAFNSSLSADTVTLATPLANGASVNVQFLLGIQQTGNFKFLVNVEALP